MVYGVRPLLPVGRTVPAAGDANGRSNKPVTAGQTSAKVSVSSGCCQLFTGESTFDVRDRSAAVADRLETAAIIGLCQGLKELTPADFLTFCCQSKVVRRSVPRYKHSRTARGSKNAKWQNLGVNRVWVNASAFVQP